MAKVLCRGKGDFNLVDHKYRSYVTEKLWREQTGRDNKGELCLHLRKITDCDPNAVLAPNVDPSTGMILFNDDCNNPSVLCTTESFGQKYAGGWVIGSTPVLFRVYFDEEAASVAIEDSGVTETNTITGRHLNDPVLNFGDLVFRTGNRLLGVLNRPVRREEQGYLVHQATTYELMDEQHPYYRITECFPNTDAWAIVREKILTEVP